MSKFKLKLMTTDAIKADQDTIRKDLISLDKRVHDNAVQCLAHAAEHGDTSLMTRLLMEIVDKKTGYRNAGLIAWMRRHSPMELKGSKIDLSGVIASEAQRKAMIAEFPEVKEELFVVGERRPFLVDEAAASDWKSSDYAKEVVKPIFQGTLVSPLTAAAKRFSDAVENTVMIEGKPHPVDAKKPFYDGLHMDAVQDFFEKVKALQLQLPVDATAELRERQRRIREDTAFVEAVNANEAQKKEPVEIVAGPKVA